MLLTVEIRRLIDSLRFIEMCREYKVVPQIYKYDRYSTIPTNTSARSVDILEQLSRHFPSLAYLENYNEVSGLQLVKEDKVLLDNLGMNLKELEHITVSERTRTVIRISNEVHLIKEKESGNVMLTDNASFIQWVHKNDNKILNNRESIRKRIGLVVTGTEIAKLLEIDRQEIKNILTNKFKGVNLSSITYYSRSYDKE